MKQKKPQSGAPPSQYQPSETEKAVLQRVLRRMASKPAPRMKVTGPGILPKVVVDHPDERVGTALLMDAIGTEDPDFLRGLLNQLFNLSLQGGLISGEDLNFMLSVIKSIQPRDPTEAMVAAQMAVAYRATMMYARHLLNVDTTQRENAARAFCKFARVYTTQMDALRRHRSGGERKVTVQHVSVQEGGQAIVGNVTHSPRETAPKEAEPSPPAPTAAKIAPMPIDEESEEGATTPTQRRTTRRKTLPHGTTAQCDRARVAAPRRARASPASRRR